MRGQHDAHCWLRAGGYDVKIVRMRGLGEVYIQAWDPQYGAFINAKPLDLSKVCVDG